ncbi:MAG: glutamate--tRNA ligase family protein, partial [Pseudomonadota bacterium]|nr:glutamate--tRNA ligase family protein [Pseudomonadota bacterium]
MVSGPVVTRFAPSPTGFLHIGGARTALFNWAFARHHGGTFLLRIEDTDRARSTDAAIDAILDGMAWLGLDADDAPVYQHKNADRHIEVAQTLLASGHAYKCYCTPEEIESMREAARAAGKPPRYDGTWRDRDPTEAPDGRAYVVRFRAPQQDEIEIDDCVQGAVTIANDQLDDMIILRSDGTPTYMLSVVIDDHDMGITHI